jgi:hypothetical protein
MEGRVMDSGYPSWMQIKDLNERIRELEAENEQLKSLADSQAKMILRLEKGGYKDDAERYRKIKRLRWSTLEQIKKSYVDAPGQPTFDEKIDAIYEAKRQGDE